MTRRAQPGTALVEPVCDVLRTIAADVLLPRFRSLGASDVWTKAPGEMVTVCDVEAHDRLARSLHELVPGAAIVSEEDPASWSTLAGRGHARPAWIVDPLDGTSNYVNGSDDYAILVALCEGGVVTTAWTYLPASDRMYVARQGLGAVRDGQPVRMGGARSDRAVPVAVVKTRYLDVDVMTAVATLPFVVAGGVGCAGVEYSQLVDGDIDLLLYWRTSPWDHAAGTLLVSEAGGRALRPDGSEYSVREDGEGLLAAASEQLWATAREHLFDTRGRG